MDWIIDQIKQRKPHHQEALMKISHSTNVDRAKFVGFGTYKVPIEECVNEIMEATKNEYPNVDNYFLWLCAVDYALEEKGLKVK